MRTSHRSALACFCLFSSLIAALNAQVVSTAERRVDDTRLMDPLINASHTAGIQPPAGGTRSPSRGTTRSDIISSSGGGEVATSTFRRGRASGQTVVINGRELGLVFQPGCGWVRNSIPASHCYSARSTSGERTVRSVTSGTRLLLPQLSGNVVTSMPATEDRLFVPTAGPSPVIPSSNLPASGMPHSASAARKGQVTADVDTLLRSTSRQ